VAECSEGKGEEVNRPIPRVGRARPTGLDERRPAATITPGSLSGSGPAATITPGSLSGSGPAATITPGGQGMSRDQHPRSDTLYIAGDR
jgi:hypothetical protein